MHKIVVGVDGSPASDEALRWAMAEARQWDATMVAIHAWEIPGSLYGLPQSVAAEGALEAAARQLLTDALARTVGGPPFRLDERTVRGSAETAVLGAAEDADMIVVGASHLGPVGRLLLGSVSSGVAHHARCPVVVVPEARVEAVV